MEAGESMRTSPMRSIAIMFLLPLWGLSTVAHGDRLISIPARLAVTPGEELEVPIHLDDGSNVFTYRVQVLFPSAELTYNRVENGSLTAGWFAPSVNLDPGVVTMAGAGWTSLSGGGEILRLVFDVTGAPQGGALSFGPLTGLNDGTTTAETTEGFFGPGFENCTADQDGDYQINLSELLRVIQFFNSPGYHCEAGTEDEYAAGPGSTGCIPHASDYSEQDWTINLSELLRVIQFFNYGGYRPCREALPPTEDGYCPEDISSLSAAF